MPSTSTNIDKTLPLLPLDMSAPPRPRTPGVVGNTSPKSAIIALPADWSVDNSPGNSANPSRSSVDGDRPSFATSFPLSASSSSSSAMFAWPETAQASSSRQPHRLSFDPASERTNPFDGSTPFSRSSTSSSSDDDDYGPRGAPTETEMRRSSVTMVPLHMRSATDPKMLHGVAIDPEISGVGHHEGFDFGTTMSPDGVENSPGDGTAGHLAPPVFNRTFSAPLPNRVGFFRHPLSSLDDPSGSFSAHPPRHAPTSTSFASLGGPDASISTPPTPEFSRSEGSAPSDALETPMQTLSMEFGESLQSAIETLLHLSPPHLFDNAKEQYSGCTVQMPTTSLSALLTSMRSLSYFSSNVQHIVEDRPRHGLVPTPDAGLLAAPTNLLKEDFDIGELVQNVADLISGLAARAGVDLVLFHGDVGIQHVSVNGDVAGLGYLLGHILRQILSVAKRGDTIELGLQLLPQSPSMTPRVSLPLAATDIDRSRRKDSCSSQASSNSPGLLSSSSSGHSGGPMLCLFEVIHNIYQPPPSVVTPRAESNPFTNLNEEHQSVLPKLDTILCRRLLQHQNATLRTDMQPSSPMGSGLPRRAYELAVLLPRGAPIVEPKQLTTAEEAVRQPFASVRLSREPTLHELALFTESLRGKKVELHASLSSLFARHLTSYLGAWGMDVSHVPVEETDETERPAVPRSSTTVADIDASMSAMSIDTSSEANGSAARFIIVDDDVSVLQRELLKIRADVSLTLKPRLSKRPTLLSRARSSPLIRQAPLPQASNLVLIHFTSIANYNNVRDVIATHLGNAGMYGSGTFGYPEVMVIPKPVGPRRFLTALHTAVNQPIVDPHFSPIATSPRSPGGGHFSGTARTPSDSGREGFFDAIPEGTSDGENAPLRVPSDGGSQKARSPLGEYPPTMGQPTFTRTDRGLHINMPSPGDVVATPASEYFNNPARIGSAGGSAVVMQSPDGRPFGMFFEPPKTTRSASITARAPTSTRKMTGRKSSVIVPENPEAERSVSRQSPAGSRRQSNATDPDQSRRGSVKIDEAAAAAGGGPSKRSSRKNSQVSDAGADKAEPAREPLIAKGRARSGTVTLDPALKRRSTASAGKSPSTEAPPSEKTKGKVAEKSHASLKKIAEEDMVVPPINVLIVEDNPINQNILSMFLKKKKIKHQTAKDGLEAVDKWKTGGFHLILMDIQLPVMDGITATGEIRKLERSNNIGVFPMTPASESPRQLATPTHEIPHLNTATPHKSSVIIVALTASSLQSDRVSALAAGCNDFLTKPVSLKWLEKKIIEWGCMQALIDFDGWRRWKSADPKDPANETKRAFGSGPQAAAKTLAGKLKINPDRRSLRQASTSSAGSTDAAIIAPLPSSPGVKIPMPKPEITISSATPDQTDTSEPGTLQDQQQNAADGLQRARSELRDIVDVAVKTPAEGEKEFQPKVEPGQTAAADSAIGMGVGPPLGLTVGAGRHSPLSGVSAEPELDKITEGRPLGKGMQPHEEGRPGVPDKAANGEEKPLPALPL